MPDVEETDGVADVVMTGDGADGAVGQGHGIARKRDHLGIMCEVKVVQAGLCELLGVT